MTVRDGMFMAVRNQGRTLVLRQHNGKVTSGCLPIISAIDAGTILDLEPLADEIVESLNAVVLPPDLVRDGSEPDVEITIREGGA